MGLLKSIKRHAGKIAVVGGLAAMLGTFVLTSKNDEYYNTPRSELGFEYLNNNKIPDAVKIEYIPNSSSENRLINIYLSLDGKDSTKLGEIKGYKLAYVSVRDESKDGKNDIVIGVYENKAFASFIIPPHYRFIFKGNGDGTFKSPERVRMPLNI
ncbi:MAG: hypothetical protein AABX55_01990 [Nanoarchaeota archaeon]